MRSIPAVRVSRSTAICASARSFTRLCCDAAACEVAQHRELFPGVFAIAQPLVHGGDRFTEYGVELEDVLRDRAERHAEQAIRAERRHAHAQ